MKSLLWASACNSFWIAFFLQLSFSCTVSSCPFHAYSLISRFTRTQSYFGSKQATMQHFWGNLSQRLISLFDWSPHIGFLGPSSSLLHLINLQLGLILVWWRWFLGLYDTHDIAAYFLIHRWFNTFFQGVLMLQFFSLPKHDMLLTLYIREVVTQKLPLGVAVVWLDDRNNGI